MIKKCKILSYNNFLNILVFDYDGKQIQTTAFLDSNCKFVFIKYENNKYEIVSKNEYDNYMNETKKKNIPAKFNKKDTEIKTENVSN